MTNNNDLGSLSYFKNMHQKEFDTLIELSHDDPIIRDMLLIIEIGTMNPFEVLVGGIQALSIINRKLMKNVIEMSQLLPAKKIIVPESKTEKDP